MQSEDFTWDLGVNFAKNNNELLELADGVENICYKPSVRPWKHVQDSHRHVLRLRLRIRRQWQQVEGTNGRYLRTPGVVPIGDILADLTGGYGLTCSTRTSVQCIGRLPERRLGTQLLESVGQVLRTLVETAEGTIREDGVTVEGVYGTYDVDEDGNVGTITYLDANGEESASAVANETTISAQGHYFYN